MKKRNIIVIGAGLAGLSAALHAAENGHEVILVSTRASERAQSVMAEGGINAALDTKGEDDSPSQHFDDTVRAACGLANPEAVRRMTEAAPDVVRRLWDMGVQFNQDSSGQIDLRNFGGQKKKRTAFAQSDSGKQIMTAMIDSVRRYEAAGMVKRMEHHLFVTLISDGGICRGCVVKDIYTGERECLRGDAVIIATGGMHGLFGDTTGSLDNTGYVTAELFRLGVPLVNGEMIQYHPTTAECGGKRMLISEAARGEGGRLLAMRDNEPWYFMEERYPELGNLMPRDITTREIWSVSRRYPVFLDMTGLDRDVMENKLSGLVDDCLVYLHTDIRRELLPVGPGIHYFMGGIQVDMDHRTKIKGLYAAGECCAQYHGANRLGGNSLLGAVYGGGIAAAHACEDEIAGGSGSGDADDIGTFMDGDTPETRTAVNKIMRGAMGVVRNGCDLKAGIAAMERLDGTLPLLGLAMLKSALAREESRGAHWREDFPRRDDERFQKNTVAVFDGKRIDISFEPV